ncbi:DUF3015 domain-containing protein [Salinisphaera orenii]|uniref:DUF3015 domain-containing protein n=1 Tax=Salinisphaera orenii YIM 95161 TaxID=1051139 RepID=A0A423Q048_9GAMM|nr:DUF3015 domain-containing protein [Salinisphaera halophila]ROO31368.1 hypothetical protein SAHL_06645 [Salinisphaera halophila YIM 95161]
MKKIIIGAVLLGSSMSASAVAPGGPGCGWGNLLFEGSSGLPAHLLATIVNGTSGNATFGMTSGTNGCDVSGTLTYSGDSLLAMNGVLEEVAQDMAVGHGEALTALTVAMQIEPADRDHFNSLMHENFTQIFPRDDISSGEVMDNITTVMKRDDRLSHYVS